MISSSLQSGCGGPGRRNRPLFGPCRRRSSTSTINAESPTARIRLRIDGRLTLEIEDRGHGMSPALIERLMNGRSALGVGIAGMRERLEQLGGTLEIESSGEATIVRAVLDVSTTP